MKYMIYDYWNDKTVVGDLSYEDVMIFVEQNEPPHNVQMGQRYGYWPEFSNAVLGTEP